LHKQGIGTVGNDRSLSAIQRRQRNRHYLARVVYCGNGVAGRASVIKVENLLPRPSSRCGPTICTVLAQPATVTVTPSIDQDRGRYLSFIGTRHTYTTENGGSNESRYDNGNNTKFLWGYAHAEDGLLARLEIILPDYFGEVKSRRFSSCRWKRVTLLDNNTGEHERNSTQINERRTLVQENKSKHERGHWK
jgi:hypothetical protein